jgi:DNA-binding MarR family transcriptional regulator
MINAFVDFTLAELSRNEIAVWFILWRDARNGVARTSQADLARRAGVADRTVRRALTTLQQRGLVDVSSRGGLGRGPSSYQLVATSSPSE